MDYIMANAHGFPEFIIFVVLFVALTWYRLIARKDKW